MSGKDPAAARFAVIQAVRLSGVAFVIVGMLAASGRLALPAWTGYPLLAVGLADVLIVPQLLARKWRTPK
ncbi:MAG TPA: hypothetical protein VJQ77_05015 [Novosphingobium sp.]|nr:hypothetical protein [Novosphingobium sp.]